MPNASITLWIDCGNNEWEEHDFEDVGHTDYVRTKFSAWAGRKGGPDAQDSDKGQQDSVLHSTWNASTHTVDDAKTYLPNGPVEKDQGEAPQLLRSFLLHHKGRAIHLR